MLDQTKPGGNNPLSSEGKKTGKGRSKAEKRGSPISRYIRNEINAAEYFRLTNQRTGK